MSHHQSVIGRDRQRFVARSLVGAAEAARMPAVGITTRLYAAFGAALQRSNRAFPSGYWRELESPPKVHAPKLENPCAGQPFAVPIAPSADLFMGHSRQKALSWALRDALDEALDGLSFGVSATTEAVCTRFGACLDDLNGAEARAFRDGLRMWAPTPRGVLGAGPIPAPTGA